MRDHGQKPRRRIAGMSVRLSKKAKSEGTMFHQKGKQSKATKINHWQRRHHQTPIGKGENGHPVRHHAGHQPPLDPHGERTRPRVRAAASRRCNPGNPRSGSRTPGFEPTPYPATLPKMSTQPNLRWGLLATGKIAHKFATDLPASRTGVLQAVASRDLTRAQSFAAAHGHPTAHGGYEALLADPEVDAVYISTPHPEHARWAIAAAQAGKHILCEKPIAMNLTEATQIVEASRSNNVFLMEAFMVRCHPQTTRIVDLVRSGALGKIQFIEATFGFRSPYDPAGRLWNKTLGGGAILDVGCYTTAMTRLLAGAAVDQPFAEPTAIAATGTRHPESGVDAYAAATLTFPDGLLAQIACGVGLQLANTVTIHGTRARLHVPTPWIIPTETHLELTPFETNHTEKIAITSTRPIYALEADTVADSIQAGKTESPAMPTADTLGNMALLDQWRTAF